MNSSVAGRDIDDVSTGTISISVTGSDMGFDVRQLRYNRLRAAMQKSMISELLEGNIPEDL